MEESSEKSQATQSWPLSLDLPAHPFDSACNYNSGYSKERSSLLLAVK